MDIITLENSLKTGKLSSNIYLLYGEERFLLENALKKIKKIFGEMINGINYIQIDNSNISEIIADIETPAFGYSSKIIIARDTGLFQKQVKKSKKENSEGKKQEKKDDLRLENKIATYIEENIEEINNSVVLVFVEESSDKNNLYKVIEKYGVVCNFEEQKPVDLARRIKAVCNAYKVNIDNNTLNYFIENCGTSLQDLINEIRKQIEYVGDNGYITKDTRDLLAVNAKEPIQKIFITLYNHFKKIYITKLAIKDNLNIAESLKLKPNQTFLVNKYTMQSKYFKEEEIRKILQEFIDLDYKVKSGNIDINVGLEAILCRYCS